MLCKWMPCQTSRYQQEKPCNRAGCGVRQADLGLNEAGSAIYWMCDLRQVPQDLVLASVKC